MLSKLMILILPIALFTLNGCKSEEERRREEEERKRDERIEKIIQADKEFFRKRDDKMIFEKYCKGKENCTQEDADRMFIKDFIKKHENKKKTN